MNKAQIIELLEKLQKFEHFQGDIRNLAAMEENTYGDWVKFEDVCKLFEIEIDSCLNVIKE